MENGVHSLTATVMAEEAASVVDAPGGGASDRAADEVVMAAAADGADANAVEYDEVPITHGACARVSSLPEHVMFLVSRAPHKIRIHLF